MKVNADLRARVAERAEFRCEYCFIHEDDAAFAHEVDHVIGRQHGGDSSLGNLAYSCMICNRFKGSNIASVNVLDEVIRLFRPRNDEWASHFKIVGAVIEPLSPIGEVTAKLLRLNSSKRVIERSLLQRTGRYPRR